MDLSYEARWLDLRRQLDVDIAYLEECADRDNSPILRAKAQALMVVRDEMDKADRVQAHQA